MPNNEFSNKGLEIIQDLIIQNIISADSLACSHALSIYGKLFSFQEYQNKKVHDILEQAFKRKVNEMSTNQLGICALGLGFGRFIGVVWTLLEKKEIHDFYDHMRIATGMGLMRQGTQAFWESFEKQFITTLPTLTADLVTQSLLVLSQSGKGSANGYEKIEKVFLSTLFKYDATNRASIFGSFARSMQGSRLLWELFDEQVESLLEEFTIDDLKMLYVELEKRKIVQQKTLDLLNDAMNN